MQRQQSWIVTGLLARLNSLPPDLCRSLINAFDADIGGRLNKNLSDVLNELEGAFLAARYSFEPGLNITRYDRECLMALSDFLSRFARSIEPIERIEWK
jgi:hypothetical protein